MRKNTEYLALMISIFGLLLLAYASRNLEPPIAKIEQISAASMGKSTRVVACVRDVHRFDGGSAILRVDDGTSEIDVYLRKSIAEDIGISADTGGIVDLVGSVEVYDGRLEIVPSISEHLRFVENDSECL